MAWDKLGDMKKSVYDTDDDDTVDDSEKLGGSTKAEVQDHTPKSHTHVEANVTDLDHDAQKIKGVTVDDSAKADQKVLTYVSSSENIEYITPAPSGAALNSIQYGSITISDAALSNTAAINTVDLAKSVMFALGDFGNATEINLFCVVLELTSDVLVTAYRVAGAAGKNAHTRFCVLEFSSGIESSQRGMATIPVSDSTVDVTINSVDTSKAVIFLTGFKCNRTGTDALKGIIPELQLLNSTTLRFTCTWTGSTIVNIGWAVLEFS